MTSTPMITPGEAIEVSPTRDGIEVRGEDDVAVTFRHTERDREIADRGEPGGETATAAEVD